MENSMDKIGEKLNTDYKENHTSIKKAKLDMIEFEDKKKELTQAVEAKTIEDKEYIQTEIKDIIEKGKNVLITLKNDIKIGSSPRMYEVFAKMTSSLIESLRELKDLNKLVADMEMFGDGLEGKRSSKLDISVTMTAKEVSELLKNASKNNEMQRIDADFKVEGSSNVSK